MKLVLHTVLLLGALGLVAAFPHIHRKPVRAGPGHGHAFDGRTGYEHDIRVRSQGTPRAVGLHSPGLLGGHGFLGGHGMGGGFLRPRGEHLGFHGRSGHIHSPSARAAGHHYA